MRYLLIVVALVAVFVEGVAFAGPGNFLNRSDAEIIKSEQDILGARKGDFIVLVGRGLVRGLPSVYEVKKHGRYWFGHEYILVDSLTGSRSREIEVSEFLYWYKRCCDMLVVPRDKTVEYLHQINTAASKNP